MASPQAENGHVDLANEIIEALAKQVISADEWRCLMVIFRKTYGWHKKEDHISNSQFSDLTGISRNHVPRILSKLVDRNIIYRRVPQSGDTPSPKQGTQYITSYGFQKDFSKWVRCPLNRGLSPKQDKGVPQSGPKVSPKQGNTKETIQKKLYKRKEQKVCDEDFWSEIRKIYAWVDINAELAKMRGYQLTERGEKWKMTRRSVINWLNRIEKPLTTTIPKKTPNPEIIPKDFVIDPHGKERLEEIIKSLSKEKSAPTPKEQETRAKLLQQGQKLIQEGL